MTATRRARVFSSDARRQSSSAPSIREMEALIRWRTDDDLPECARLLDSVSRADGYPTFWPDDPIGWLCPAALLGAWVAERASHIVGHVALRAGTAEPGGEVWSDATGLPPEQLAAVNRLFVAPASRGTGIGSALLETACGAAVSHRLHPVLDVAETDHEAIALYERRGWRRVHSETWRADESGRKLLHYYVAPNAKL